MGFAIKLLFLLLVNLVAFSTAELEAILAEARLPVAADYIRSIYDGDDSIFIFGGGKNGTGELNTILQYQISNDTISSVASLPSRRSGGGISCDSSGNIFYLGGNDGVSYTRTVFKFNPVSGNVDDLTELEATFYRGAFVTHSDIAYLIGGDSNSTSTQYVHCYNMSTSINCGVTEITGESQFYRGSAFAQGDKAIVFGTAAGTNVLVLNLTTLDSHVAETTLSDISVETSVTTDGQYAYLIGGWRNSSQTPMDSLIRFDPLTFTHEYIHVKNHPAWEEASNIFWATSTVYVEKLNRIDIFGGYSSAVGYHDEIWFIDLSPLTPTAPTDPTDSVSTTVIPTTSTMNPDHFNCEGKPNGMYPHPSDCSMFISCHDGSMEVFPCPPPLLFNPEKDACDFPQFVQCGISCIGRPDGMYPHPHNCQLFIGCFQEDLQLFKCPDPLLFDPDLLACRLPEEVDCHVM